MTKKVLIAIILILFFILAGLLVVYVYHHKQISRDKEILSLVPPNSHLIVRITRTSETVNSFFSYPASEILGLQLIQKNWVTIDSITKRNYKTAEILQRNTSYICLDSMGNFLILVDLNNRTNEHFIDQFLVNSVPRKKIEKHPEGYKSFFTENDRSLHYFVKHNAFAISSSVDFLLSSMKNADAEKVDSQIHLWDEESEEAISVWGDRAGWRTIAMIINISDVFGDWPLVFSTGFSMEVIPGKEKFTFEGKLNLDSASGRLASFSNQDEAWTWYGYQADTGTVINECYRVFVKDTMGKLQPFVFSFHKFADTSWLDNQFMISRGDLVPYLFKSIATDTSVQMITMADETLGPVAVINIQKVRQLIPNLPFTADTGKVFGTLTSDYLFISGAIETLIAWAPVYPQTRLSKQKLESKVFIYRSVYINHNRQRFEVTHRYVWSNKTQLRFMAEILPLKGK